LVYRIIKKGNVAKNSWWIFKLKTLIWSRKPEEEASSAGEQLASNKVYQL
jgi:hypothetical protein